jgi:signal transduction histidine kinase
MADMESGAFRRPGGGHIPAIVDSPRMTPDASRWFHWFDIAAAVTWLACGLWPLSAALSGRFPGGPALAYVIVFVINGATLAAILTLPRRAHVAHSPRLYFLLLFVQSATAVALNALTLLYLGGTGAGLGFLVIVAAALPYFLGARQTWTWIVVQTVAMFAFVADGLTTVEGLTFAIAAIGFQVFAASSSMLAISEGRARNDFARANAELTATRELLAENSRTSERLRISRDLHDTLGHHLTALSLQLDVAARLAEGNAAEHVRQAHAVTRLLLSDVRDVVSSLRESSRLNLAAAIKALTIQPGEARIHLTLPETLAVEDTARAETLLRAVQEVLTNTARHSCARNLWIQLEARDGGIMLHTRDDGRGTNVLTLGNGLRGMHERFQEHGGRVEVNSSAGGGFDVQAFLPLTSSA